MKGFVDLHCHWIAAIDDGAPTPAVGVEMLSRLKAIGFDRVVATPHMRPGLFDNDKAALEAAFEKMQPHLSGRSDLPDVDLSSEHYFDDTIYARLLSGDALPYPGGRAVLLEFYDIEFLPNVDKMLFEIRRRQLLPVIAHPERYPSIWRSPDQLERLVDAGVAALLDTAALVGKYGERPKRCAESLLEEGLYQAACSDAHRPPDVDAVEEGMRIIERKYGKEELDLLFREGPKQILAGRSQD